MADVFVSYSSQDRGAALELVEDLERQGFNVWWDRNMYPGQDIYDTILEELDAARAVVVVWTVNSIKSKFVQSEARRASHKGKLVPLRSKDVEINDLPIPFDCIQTALIEDRTAILGSISKLVGDRVRHTSVSEGRFRPVEWDGISTCLIGLLVLPGIRAWLVVHGTSTVLTGSELLSNGVSVLHEHRGVFQDRDAAVRKFIADSLPYLNELSAHIGGALSLVLPFSVNSNTYTRFIRSDQRYVFKESFGLPKRSLPRFLDDSIPAVTLLDDVWKAISLPSDYLAEAFGIEVVRTERIKQEDRIIRGLLTLKEDTMLRGAKYIIVESPSLRLYEIVRLDRDLGEHTTVVEELQSARLASARAIGRRKAQLRFADLAVVESAVQLARKESGRAPTCSSCQDEREIQVRSGVRLYRVPCPVCSADEGDSWRVFFHTSATESAREPKATLQQPGDVLASLLRTTQPEYAHRPGNPSWLGRLLSKLAARR